MNTTANASGYNQFIGFGDSTMDSGYFRYNPTGGFPSLPPGSSIDELIAVTVAACLHAIEVKLGLPAKNRKVKQKELGRVTSLQ